MRITRANRKSVEYACKHFHYAKSVPAVQYAYNVYNNDDEWCGVIIYGGSSTPNIAKSFGVNQGEILELERVALNGKQEYTSQAVAMSLRQLHKDNPLVRMVVSYSDHRQGHLGTIYQATNWIYLGLSEPACDEIFYKGKWTHRRTIFAQKNPQALLATCPRRRISNKFRYLYCFNKNDRKRYLKQALPYPKDADLTEVDHGSTV